MGDMNDEQYYRELVESVNSVVLRWKQDGSITFINQYGLKLFGYEPDELIGKSVDILVPETDSQGKDLSGLLEDITKNPGDYVHNVNENVCRDGRRIWMSWTNRAIYDANGQLTEVLGIGSDITDIKQNEEDLRKSKTMLMQAQRIAHLGYWDRDLRTDEVLWSDEVYRIFGIQPRNVRETFETFLDFVHTDDRQSVIEATRALIDPTCKIDIEYRIIRPDGFERIIAERGETIYTAGKPSHLIGTILDITEHKQIEQTIRKNQERQEFLLKVSDALRRVNNVIDLYRLVSPLLGEFIGADRVHYAESDPDKGYTLIRSDYSREGLESLSGNYSTDDFEEILSRLQQGETIIVHDTEMSNRLTEKARFTMRSLGARSLLSIPLLHEENLIRTLNVVMNTPRSWTLEEIELVKEVGNRTRDAIGRLLAEEELRWSRDELEVRIKERTKELERQANLLELANDAIIVRDMENRIVFWNHGAENMYGWTKEQVVAAYSNDLLRTRYPASFDEAMTTLMQAGRWEGELEHTTKDGRAIITLSRQVLQRDETGHPVGILEINTDITTARQIEEQLRQSQKMQAIGTLAGGIAHDFNNILAAIVGFTEMTIDDIPDRPEARRNLRQVLKSALRARDLVKQILAFSRKTDYARQPVAIIPLIKETLQLLRASIPSNIEMRTSFMASSDVVRATPVEIQQIVMNLVTNASLAMEEKGGVLEINLTDIDLAANFDAMPEEYVQLSVKDKGTGISPDIIKRLFEPFFTTRDIHRGSGMGLAVVYGIVKDLGGIITVESKSGQGSTFRVNIPKIEETPEKVEPDTAYAPGGEERILFVDDEDLVVDWAKTMLERLGYKVVAVQNSLEALKIFTSDPSQFDLVVADQAMPGMTGMELTKKLLALRNDIPIILCTGHSEVVNAATAKKSGISEFLMKPLAKTEFAQAVRRVLMQHSPAVPDKSK